MAEALGIEKALLLALLTPLAVLMVWWGLQRVRKRLERDEGGGH